MGKRVEVAKVNDVPPGTSRQVDAGGATVALFNVGGTFYAIGGTCTHRGGPLGEGDLDGTTVTCPWHGSEFDVTSGTVQGPPAVENVPSYRVVVEGDAVTVELP